MNKMTNQEYQTFAENKMRLPLWKNSYSLGVGGTICLLGQIILNYLIP